MIRFKEFLLEYLTPLQSKRLKDQVRKAYPEHEQYMTPKARQDTDHFFGKGKDTLPVVFMSAGGPPNSKLINSEHKDKLPAVYMNAGGPPENQNITESTKNYPIRLETLDETLTDPLVDNKGAGDVNNHHSKLINPPSVVISKLRHTYSNLTDAHVETYKTLAKNTNNNDPDYKEEVPKYTSGSRDINEFLFRIHTKNKSKPLIPQAEFDTRVKKIDKLINSHKTHDDMFVYTGPHFHPRDYAGKTVEAPAYTSTSLTPHVAKDFGIGRHILRIHLPKGHPHLFMDPESQYQGQAEVILPRGIKLKIASKPSHIITGFFNNHFYNYNNNDETDYHFWDAHIVNNKE